jgi:hypothetical protein
MKIMKQLSIFLKNRPGTLAAVCDHLREEGINIVGFSVSDTVDHAVVRIVVDEPMKAVHLLGNAGVLVVENDIIALNLRNEPGQLAKLGTRLGDAGINIEYAYGGLAVEAKAGILYVRVSDVQKAFDVLSSDYSK